MYLKLHKKKHDCIMVSYRACDNAKKENVFIQYLLPAI